MPNNRYNERIWPTLHNLAHTEFIEVWPKDGIADEVHADLERLGVNGYAQSLPAIQTLRCIQAVDDASSRESAVEALMEAASHRDIVIRFVLRKLDSWSLSFDQNSDPQACIGADSGFFVFPRHIWEKTTGSKLTADAALRFLNERKAILEGDLNGSLCEWKWIAASGCEAYSESGFTTVEDALLDALQMHPSCRFEETGIVPHQAAGR